jgi:hypothetical protein
VFRVRRDDDIERDLRQLELRDVPELVELLRTRRRRRRRRGDGRQQERDA